MANYFDQFDQPAANYFDQFDEGATPPQPEKRSWGDALKDSLLALGSGAGSVGEIAGTAYGLATGDMDNPVRQAGQDAREFYESKKSPGLLAREQDRAKKIEAADGEFAKFGTAIASTVKDPALLSNFLTEQIPQLVGPAAIGRVLKWGSKALGVGSKTAEAVAVGGAVGTGAAMQGADMGGGAYDDLMDPRKVTDAMWAENEVYSELTRIGVPTDEAKRQVALLLGRQAAAGGGAASVAAQFLPGGRAIERAIVGAGARKGGRAVGALKGAAGEGLSESAEEGAGAVAANLAVGEVDPTRAPTAGVGEAAGMGFIGGVGMGGVAGAVQRPQVDVPKPDPIKPILDAKNVDEAIAAAQNAVAFTPPDIPAMKADNLALAPEPSVDAVPPLDLPSVDPLAPAGAVEQAEAAQAARQQQEAEGLPFEPTPVAAPLELAPEAPAVDAIPYDGPLERAAPIEAATLETVENIPRNIPASAQAPELEDFLAPKDVPARNVKKGEPYRFQTEKGARSYAQLNKLKGYTPRASGRAFLLSKPKAAPLELAPREGENVSDASQRPPVQGSPAQGERAPAPDARPGEAGPAGSPAQGTDARGEVPAPVRGADAAALPGAPVADAPAPGAVAGAQPAPDAPVDFTAPKKIPAKGIVKGQVLTFKTEKSAALYAKANRVRNYLPRETKPGEWVLTKRPRTEAQKANDAKLKAKAKTVAPDDDLRALLAKNGGIRASELTADGADQADLSDALAFAFRKEGGMSLDAAAELMAEHGFDVYDGEQVDASKARELLQKALDGEKVYTPQGMEIRAAKDREAQRKANPNLPDGIDRRADATERKRIDDMTLDEARQALRTDVLTGIGNRRAWDELRAESPKAVVTAIDVDSLGWLNDAMGHAAADEVLAAIGRAFKTEGVEAWRTGGDELMAHFDTEDQARDAMERVRAVLDKATFTAIKGDERITKTGVGLSYGLGPDPKTADDDLYQDKRWREDAGVRPPKKAEPPGVRREPAVQAGPGGSETPGRVEPAPQSAPEAPAPAGVSTSDPLADVPPAFIRRFTVPVEQYHEGEGAVKTVQMSAAKALAENQAEIDAYEKLLACVSA